MWRAAASSMGYLTSAADKVCSFFWQMHCKHDFLGIGKKSLIFLSQIFLALHKLTYCALFPSSTFSKKKRISHFKCIPVNREILDIQIQINLYFSYTGKLLIDKTFTMYNQKY